MSIILTIKELQTFLETVEATLEFDVETTGLKSIDTLTSIQLGNGKDTIFIPLNQEGCIPEKTVIELLKPKFYSTEAVKVAHNIKFDARVLKRYGISVNPPYFDTLIATALVYPDLGRKVGKGWKDKYSLKSLMAHFFEITSPGWKEFLKQNKLEVEVEGKNGKLRRKKVTPKSLAELPFEVQADYALKDIVYARQLRELIEPRMGQKERWIFDNIEMKVVPILLDMEVAGIKVDIPFIKTKIPEYTGIRDSLSTKIYKEAGREFDLNKNDEIRKVLLYDLKEPVPLYKKTKKSDELAVDSTALLPFAKSYPVCEWICEWRKYAKLLSTYCIPYLTLIDNQHRLHSEFGITATGRLTSSEPNLQNIPKRDDKEAEVRQFFIPDKGYVFGCLDYSQMEYAMVAHYSKDELLCSLIKTKEDLHTRTAIIAFGDAEKRSEGKTINFATLFGQAPSTLASTLGIGYWEADTIRKAIISDYPKVSEWFYGTKQASRLTGITSTIFGRTRKLHLASSSEFQKDCMALNTPIQGSCAELVKIAMIRWNNLKNKMGFKTRLVLQVHDELVFEIPENEIKEVEPYLIGIAESVSIVGDTVLEVPMWVDYEVRDKSWGQAE